MPRYEGMDDLLQRVRDQLGVDEGADADAAQKSLLQTVAPQGPYEHALEGVLLLMHDAEQLRRLLAPEQLRLLTSEQCDDLQSILTRALQELWSCESTLQRMMQAE